MRDARLSRLTILQMNKNKDVDIDGVVMEFAHLEGRGLTFCFCNLLDGVAVLPFFPQTLYLTDSTKRLVK